MARNNKTQHVGNYGAFEHDFGRGNFTTTGTSVEVDTILTNIVSVSITAAETMADTESLFINEPLVTSGGITVDADGQVTIGRVVETGGTATSDLEFFYHFIGN